MAKSNSSTPAEPGVAVDARGIPAVDPTANVLLLVSAESRRQDDLRIADGRRIDTELACVKEISLLQAKHVKELGDLRADYTGRLGDAESKRIDAIRAVDVNAVAIANERQAASASVLANQVATSADALRTLVAQTASTIAEQLRVQMTQITDRLSLVERAQYEGRGKGAGMDKLMALGIAVAGVALAAAAFWK